MGKAYGYVAAQADAPAIILIITLLLTIPITIYIARKYNL